MPKKNTSLGKAKRLMLILEMIKRDGPIGADDISNRLKELHDFKDDQKATIRRRTFTDIKTLLNDEEISKSSEHGKYEVQGCKVLYSGQRLLEDAGYRLEFPSGRKLPWSVWNSVEEVRKTPHFRLMIFDSGEPLFVSFPKDDVPMSLVVGRCWSEKNRRSELIAQRLVERYGQRTAYLGIRSANLRISTAPEKRVHYGNLFIKFGEDRSISIERCHSSAKIGLSSISKEQTELIHALPFSEYPLSKRKLWWDSNLRELPYTKVSSDVLSAELPVVIAVEPNFNIILCDEKFQPNEKLKKKINEQSRQAPPEAHATTGDQSSELISQIETDIDSLDQFLKLFPLSQNKAKAV